MLKLADGIRHFRLYCAILKEKGEETDVNLVGIGFRECHVHVQILLEEIIMCCDENETDYPLRRIAICFRTTRRTLLPPLVRQSL